MHPNIRLLSRYRSRGIHKGYRYPARGLNLRAARLRDAAKNAVSIFSLNTAAGLRRRALNLCAGVLISLICPASVSAGPETLAPSMKLSVTVDFPDDVRNGPFTVARVD